jgi:iron complex outermembrane receptor protein
MGQSEPLEIVEEVVVVAAHPLSGEGLSQASEVLVGDELSRKQAASIGATLANEPGIHSAQFGNAVGRPVIHGLSGPRIRIMEDRIDTLDVSVTSADHAVAVEPFIAERIEVLKGSSALLYGSGAIGGVIDVHTGRIPHRVPDEGMTGGIESRYDDNTEGTTTSGKLNGGGGQFAWHLDGTWKDGDEYEIPGFAESARLRTIEEAEEAEEDEDHEEVRGRLPGSQFDSEAYAGGASIVGEWGFLGASVSQLDANYGLPGGHGHEEEEGAEEEHGTQTPMLDMKQTRTDVELGVDDPFGVFTGLNLRLGINDYEHEEIEPNGEVATRFTNEAWELRTELIYAQDAWNGVLGVQYTSREFSAVGEEAFVPPVDSRDTGVFWVAERKFDGFDLETGLRMGQVSHEPQLGPDEDFTTYAASLGFVVPLNESSDLGLVVDYSSRAPVIEELYSDGPHLVTGAFELGDPSLDSEKAANVSATLRHRSDRWGVVATAYYSRFSDFIYEQATGAEEDGLPVFQFRQDDATFMGIDAEVNFQFANWDGGYAELRGMVDLVNPELDVSGNENMPRIPPLRYGIGVLGQFGQVTASIDYTRATEQDDVTDQELVTGAYEDLRAHVNAEFPVGESTFSVFISGKNLTDDEQRRHTSFIKDFAPAPGRTLEAGLRYLF